MGFQPPKCELKCAETRRGETNEGDDIAKAANRARLLSMCRNAERGKTSPSYVPSLPFLPLIAYALLILRVFLLPPFPPDFFFFFFEKLATTFQPRLERQTALLLSRPGFLNFSL